MKKTRTHYDRSFKEHAVKLSYERKNQAELARELGIDPSLFRRWRLEYAKFNEKSFQGNGIPRMSDEQQTIMSLRKENAYLKEESEILKKALGIISTSDRVR